VKEDGEQGDKHPAETKQPQSALSLRKRKRGRKAGCEGHGNRSSRF
jgi:hypothetical protein